MENFFTKTPEEFERFTRKSEDPFVPEGEGGKPKREAYRYAMVRLHSIAHSPPNEVLTSTSNLNAMRCGGSQINSSCARNSIV